MLYVIYVLVYRTWTDWDLIFCMAALMGCMLPDVDLPNTLVGYIIPLHLFFKHGGATHTLLFNSIFFIAYCITKHPVWLGIGVGYFSHLLGDNIQGNNLKYLYYPFKRKRRKK